MWKVTWWNTKPFPPFVDLFVAWRFGWWLLLSGPHQPTLPRVVIGSCGMSTCPCPIVFFLLRAGAVVPMFLLAAETTEVDPPLPSSFKMKESEPFSGRLVVAGGGATATAGE